MKKNILFISAIILFFFTNLFSQTLEYRGPGRGTISKYQTGYVDNINIEYHIDMQAQTPVLFSGTIGFPDFGDVNMGYDGDYAEIYAVEANDTRRLLYSSKTNLGIKTFSKFSTNTSTGKAIVKIYTNSSRSYNYWREYDYCNGVNLEYSVNHTLSGNMIIEGDLKVSGESTLNNDVQIGGNLGLGPLLFQSRLSISGNDAGYRYGLRVIKSATNSNDNYGIHSEYSTASTGNIYGIYSKMARGTGTNLYPDKTWAGYFTGGKVEVNSGNLIVSNGKVGIGTTSLVSSHLLDVNGNIRGKNIDIALNSLIGYDSGIIFWYDNKYMGYHAAGWFEDTWSDNGYTYWLSGNAGIKFFTNEQPRMAINTNGDIGIGTVTPGTKLDVVGTIRAHEVRVCLNQGCDFVFDPNYKLMPLNELDAFISKNRHLPEVAPAAVMESEGINLSEMNALLLQKIEEQTLYIIELNKRLSELENKIK